MCRKLLSLAGISFLLMCFWRFVEPPPSPDARIKGQLQRCFRLFLADLRSLDSAVAHDASDAYIRRFFVKSRISYKKLEPLIGYYFDLDISRFNGPAINFIEEEDPTAYRRPQGLQVIESLIYPHYNRSKKLEIYANCDALIELSEGLSANATNNFEPAGYGLEAAMEAVYRVIALGITGFDSPVALNSLPEAAASLNGINELLACYAETPQGKHFYAAERKIITAASGYLNVNRNFNSFNRMEFIITYLNPLCEVIGRQRQQLGQKDNPFHYSLINKSTQLFAEASLRRNAYLFDDTITAARIRLGRKLFSEPLLAANGKRSCASCHQPSRGFTDGKAKAIELDGHSALPRNTPTVLNAAFQHNLFYDSRQVSLDQLITEVLGNEKEMNLGRDLSMSKLQGNQSYLQLYASAYPLQQGVMKSKDLVNAISMYLRTLISYNSRFDQQMRGKGKVMTSTEMAGFNLFAGKARCATCHFIPLFNGSKPPSYFYQESEVIGVPATVEKLHATLDSDMGRFSLINKEFLRNSFKTPTLRNVALTAPYMHNGVFPDLKSVLSFYNKGGGRGLNLPVPNQTLPFNSLGLTNREEDQIIAFLKSLTDTVSYKRAY